MGHSVVLFLWTASPVLTWQFWVIEASVASFWLIPLSDQAYAVPDAAGQLSVQTLNCFPQPVRLLFFYGGISSAFHALADHRPPAWASSIWRIAPCWCWRSVSTQLALFVAARLLNGNFEVLLPMSSLTYVNLISIMAAIAYTTLLSVYYETVMRESDALQQATRAHRMQTEALA